MISRAGKARGLDQTGTFTADQTFVDAAPQHGFESRRSRSLSRKRPCRFFEKVE